MTLPIARTDADEPDFHPSLEQTAARAAMWHGAQVDPAGRPHVEHLIDVSAALLRMFPDASWAERHAGWLHDVIDDTRISLQNLTDVGYAPEVVLIVAAVSRASQPHAFYADWVAALAETAPIGALRVKLAELSCTGDPDRMDMIEGEHAKSTSAEYAAATARLRKALADRLRTVDTPDPQPADMIPVTVYLEAVDFWMLGEAAAKADRRIEDFMAEEALSLADHILATGTLRHVELARHRQEKATAFLNAFRASARKSGPLKNFLPASPREEPPGDAPKDRPDTDR